MMNLARQPLVIVTWIFILALAFFRFAPSLPLSVSTQAKGEPFIVTETGTAAKAPDMAVVTLGITESGASLASVQNSVDTKSNSLVAAVKTLGVEEKDIQTANYNIQPNYDFSGSTQRITGYSANLNYTVKIRDFDKVNEILEAGTGSGANMIGNIALTFSDETRETLLEEARKEALDGAKTKAEGLARAAGITLGRIINISESETGTVPPALYLAREQANGLGGDASLANIAGGESEVAVTISLFWEVR